MLELVKPDIKYKQQYIEMMKEWEASGEKIIPYSIREADYNNFKTMIEGFENESKGINLKPDQVPATTFWAYDDETDKIVGAVNIRHRLNEKLLKHGGHIGDGVRPSERKKGYATEIIKLALEKCKQLGIDRVLMVCYKDNIGSKKSIIKNGGILENEVQTEDGKIDQRYWISLKKRVADKYVRNKVKEVEQKIISVSNSYFTGDIYFYNFFDVVKKILISNGKTILDNNYKWLEFYDYNSKVKLTAIYDENNNNVEWYFDIAKEIGKENGIAYEDDMYLDVVVTPTGEIILLDEDELKDALDRYEISKSDYENAYKEAYSLMDKLQGKVDALKEYTDAFFKQFLEMK